MKADERKSQILDCSRKFFANKGYYETHVEDVIKEAKVGKGTFYRYFKNKEDLFISLLRKYVIEWRKAVFIDSMNEKKTNVFDFFKYLVSKSFKFFSENEDLCLIYLRVGPGINERFEELMEEFEKQILQYVIDYLEDGKRLGQLRDSLDIELTANMIMGAFFRVDYYYFVLKGEKNAVDIDEMADNFFDIIANGIMKS